MRSALRVVCDGLAASAYCLCLGAVSLAVKLQPVNERTQPELGVQHFLISQFSQELLSGRCSTSEAQERLLTAVLVQ